LGFNLIGIGNSLASFTPGNGDMENITNPMLGPLADNGGVMLLNGTRIKTHALLAGSPAINTGNPSFSPNSFTPAMTTDQRGAGFPRVLGGRIDVGAFESLISPFTADFDADGDVDGTDFMTWQRNNGLAFGATKAQGDANGDGRVNAADLTILKSQFGLASSEAEVAQAATAPMAASTEPVASPAVAAFATSSSSPSSGVAFIAGAGVPGASTASRSAYRPPVDRRAALHDAVHAYRGAPFAGWSTANGEQDDAGIGGADSDDAASDADASAEDAVFTLLGEGVL
jgi:hypothetical protein